MRFEQLLDAARDVGYDRLRAGLDTGHPGDTLQRLEASGEGADAQAGAAQVYSNSQFIHRLLVLRVVRAVARCNAGIVIIFPQLEQGIAAEDALERGPARGSAG